jgi:hypothetical protein
MIYQLYIKMSTVFLLRLIAHTLMSLYEQASNKYVSQIKIQLIVINRHHILPSSFWQISSSQSYRNRPMDRQIDRIVNKEIPTTY